MDVFRRFSKVGLTKCCPNNLVQYNTATEEIEIIAEVGTAELVVNDIMEIFDEFGNVVGYDTTWVLVGDFFNAVVGGGVIDGQGESIYLLRNERIVNISLSNGLLVEQAPAEDVREIVGLEQETGRLFGKTACCPNEIVAIDPFTGARSVIAEVGTTENVLVDVIIEYDENGNEVSRDSLWELRGDFFSTVTGPSLPSADEGRVFFIRNEHLLLVETISGQLIEGPLMDEQRLLAYDEVKEALYFRTGCCPNKLQKYSLGDRQLTTIAEIGTSSDRFPISLGMMVYDEVNEQFYLRRNDKLLIVSLAGEEVIAENEVLNELSIVGGLSHATTIGYEDEIDLENDLSAITANPNPFRNQINVTLTSRSKDEIRFEIYDILGRRLQMLYSGRLQVGQPQLFHFHTDDWPSGTYFLRYTSSGYSETKTVVLTR